MDGIDEKMARLEVAQRRYRTGGVVVARAAIDAVEAMRVVDRLPCIFRIVQAVGDELLLDDGWVNLRCSKRGRVVLAKQVVARLGKMAGMSFYEIAAPFGVAHTTFRQSYQRQSSRADEIAAKLWQRLTEQERK